MMPAYFPFTFISPSSLSRLVACFGPLALYRPSRLDLPDHIQAAADQGEIELRIPVSGDATEMRQRIQAYREWAQDHAGSEKGWFQAGLDAAPFADDATPRGIRGALRRDMEGRDLQPRPDPLATARLFLEIAQDRDRRQWEISQDLARLDSMEKKLFSQLRPGEELAAAPFPAPVDSGPLDSDPGRILTRQRLASWARLMLADEGSAPRWLVTDSQEVALWIREMVAGVCPVAGGAPLMLPRENVPAGQQETISGFVRALINEQAEPDLPDIFDGEASEPCLQAVFFRVPEMTLRQMVGSWISEDLSPGDSEKGNDPGKHAVFAQIQAG